MKQKRTPRPKGTTETKDLNVRRTLILNHYINTGFMYCGKPYTLDEFQTLVGIDRQEINKAIVENGNTLYKLMDQQTQGEMLRAFGALAFSDALDDRTRALQQYNILANAQGQDYKPFISGEVNRALKLTLDTSAQMVNLIKALTASGPNIFVSQPVGPNAPELTEQYMTTEKALELINKQNNEQAPLLEDDSAKEQLFLDHGLADTPEVQANKQQGIDASKEGLSINQLAEISDAIILEDLEPTGHTDRRAQTLDIDLGADQI